MNLAVNFIGNAWTGIFSIIFVPIYLNYIGVEAYGLIGIFAAVQAAMNIMDLGLGASLIREVAQLSAAPNKTQELNDIVRTLEVIYSFTAIFLGVVAVSLAPVLAYYWVKSDKLSSNTVLQAFIIMGIGFIFQWLIGFYAGGLLGLQKQVLLNLVNIICVTLRNVGAIAILAFLSPTIQAFLIWHSAINIVQAVTLAICLWKLLPIPDSKPKFQLGLFKKLWRFATGMSGISLMTLLLTQMDKVILSKILTLENFGYYVFAGTVAANLSRLTRPIFDSVYPRLSHLTTLGNDQEVARVYHQGSQFLSVLILPVGLIITFFANEILLLWTHDPVKAENTHILLSLLMVGYLINGLYQMPYTLQLAYGKTKLLFFSALGAVLVLVPLMIFFVPIYGALGAAAIWVALNTGMVLLTVQLMHQKLLRGEMWRWYFEDIGLILFPTLCVIIIGRWFISEKSSPLEMLLELGLVSFFSLLTAVFTSPLFRRRAITFYQNKFGST